MELSKCNLEYYSQINTLSLKIYSDLQVKLINTEDKVFAPSKKHNSDAGFDCRARIEEPYVLEPGKRVKIPLGFGINIPLNHTGDLRSRSGLMSNYGIVVGYGTVDPGYTGEVQATIFNFGEEPFTINPKDRIAQIVVVPTVTGGTKQQPISIKLVDKLVELERGEGGHGSTGIK